MQGSFLDLLIVFLIYSLHSSLAQDLYFTGKIVKKQHLLPHYSIRNQWHSFTDLNLNYKYFHFVRFTVQWLVFTAVFTTLSAQDYFLGEAVNFVS